MRKTMTAAAIAALAATAALGVNANAGSTAKVKDANTRCIVSKAETLVANADSRVYTIDRKDSAEASNTAVYACSFRTGKRVPLGTVTLPFDEDSDATTRYLRNIVLTGDYGDGVGPGVAYVQSTCRTSCSARVIVRSLRTGKATMKLKAGSPFDPIALSQPTDQGGFALAWLESSPDGSCETGCRVHVVREKGDEVLGEGTDIDTDVFGAIADERPGIIASGGSNTFVWKKGDAIKVSSFNGDVPTIGRRP